MVFEVSDKLTVVAPVQHYGITVPGVPFLGHYATLRTTVQGLPYKRTD